MFDAAAVKRAAFGSGAPNPRLMPIVKQSAIPLSLNRVGMSAGTAPTKPSSRRSTSVGPRMPAFDEDGDMVESEEFIVQPAARGHGGKGTPVSVIRRGTTGANTGGNATRSPDVAPRGRPSSAARELPTDQDEFVYPESNTWGGVDESPRSARGRLLPPQTFYSDDYDQTPRSAVSRHIHATPLSERTASPPIVSAYTQSKLTPKGPNHNSRLTGLTSDTDHGDAQLDRPATKSKRTPKIVADPFRQR
jgi:hypothetical protein